MPQSTEAERRKAALIAELNADIESESNLALNTHRGSLALMVVALLCSFAATICGVFLGVSGKIVGGIALFPPLIAYIAVNLKLEAKSSWHARKADALEELRARLGYQQPESPTIDNIAAVSRDRTEMTKKMQVEWDKNLMLNFSGLVKHRDKN